MLKTGFIKKERKASRSVQESKKKSTAILKAVQTVSRFLFVSYSSPCHSSGEEECSTSLPSLPSWQTSNTSWRLSLCKPFLFPWKEVVSYEPSSHFSWRVLFLKRILFIYCFSDRRTPFASRSFMQNSFVFILFVGEFFWRNSSKQEIVAIKENVIIIAIGRCVLTSSPCFSYSRLVEPCHQGRGGPAWKLPPPPPHRDHRCRQTLLCPTQHVRDSFGIDWPVQLRLHYSCGRGLCWHYPCYLCMNIHSLYQVPYWIHLVLVVDFEPHLRHDLGFAQERREDGDCQEAGRIWFAKLLIKCLGFIAWHMQTFQPTGRIEF